MIVNKYSNGGGGSGSQGPIGPQGIEGAQGYQGPVGQDGIDQNPTVLKSVAELPESAETGDLVSLSVEEQGLPNGILFEERNDLGENQDKTGGRFQFEIGAFDGIAESDALYVGKVITPNNSEISLYIYENEWKTGGAVLSDSNGNLYISMGVDSDSAGESNIESAIFNYQYTSSEDEYMVVDIYPEDTGEVTFDIPQGGVEANGVYQYDGEGWKRIDSIVHLDSLEDTEGVSGIIYECNGRFLKWVNGAGRWGKWIIAMDGNMYNNLGTTFNTYNISQTSYLVYTYLPFTSTTLLCGFQIVANNKYLGYFPEDNKLKVFDDTGLTGTSIAEISMDGEEADITASNRHMYISWVDNRIIFRNSDAFCKMAGRYVDTSVSAPHYEALDVDYFDGTANIDKTAGAGFAMWNSEGKVIGGAAPNKKVIYFNTTGYSPSISVVYQQDVSTPNRIWVPTQGGTAGQLLISGGDNAAPVWSNWIKSVKITSDAYEALATKDPNTLYCIVDE